MTPRTTDLQLPPERTFGLFFATVCAAASAWTWATSRGTNAAAFGLVALLFLAAALAAPRLLRPLNLAWYRLGLVLGAIVSPIALGLIFFGLLTPIAIAMRIAGRNELRLGTDAEARTYWQDRERPGPDAASFGNQF